MHASSSSQQATDDTSPQPRERVRRVEDLRTPCLVLHRHVAERNAKRMLTRATLLGVTLRPHVKTHKTLQGAHLQVMLSSNSPPRGTNPQSSRDRR
jgi:D-serine deaminase-like pyridoxal phosphate-dependent protein